MFDIFMNYRQRQFPTHTIFKCLVLRSLRASLGSGKISLAWDFLVVRGVFGEAKLVTEIVYPKSVTAQPKYYYFPCYRYNRYPHRSSIKCVEGAQTFVTFAA